MEKLKAGDKAPFFKGVTTSGREVSLDDYKSCKLVLYFYPKDNTSGCTAEACSLRDGYSELKAAGFEVLGVSPDSVKSHEGFTAKHSLPFELLSDADHAVAEAYGCWGLKKFMGREYMGMLRTTFVINDGVIERVFDKVRTKDHFIQIMDSYK